MKRKVFNIQDFLLELEKAKNGNEIALAKIIANRMYVIRIYAKRASLYGLEFDDAIQEGLIGLFNAINTFKLTNLASFNTYASVCIKNEILKAVKKVNRKKNQVLNNALEYDEHKSTKDPEEILIDYENYTYILNKINSNLSKLEKRVLKLFLQGKSYSEISKTLSCSLKVVDNALNRARQKLKK